MPPIHSEPQPDHDGPHLSTAELVDRKIRGYAQLDAIDDFCRKRRKSFDTVEDEDEFEDAFEDGSEDEEDHEDEY